MTLGLKTPDRNPHSIPTEALDGLRASLRGIVCLPGRPGSTTPARSGTR
jgi:hypothetical protein